MKIITRAVLDWATGAILEEEYHEYTGPVAACKDSGSAPQPVDPYTQAAAQYGLSTGTAEFNAGLNRTNQVNPLGSSVWSVNGQPTAQVSTGQPPQMTGFHSSNGGLPPSAGPSATAGQGMPAYGLGGEPSPGRGISPGFGYAGVPAGVGGNYTLPAPSAAPTYTNVTQLAPQFQSVLDQPINTSGLPGMPGGPSITQDLQNTQKAIYNQQEGYLQPQQQLAGEQLNSQLAAEGALPGSAAYNNAKAEMGRENTFANQQAANAAITGGEQEQANLFGLGTQALQNQINVRNAPLNEYETLAGNGAGAQATAMTPDISGAFGQQYQGQLAGYNADVASNNATDSTIGSLAMLAAIYF